MATILEDDFNAYNNGDLNGQGPWGGDASYDVQDTVVYEGAKAVVGTQLTSQVLITAAGDDIASGQIGFYAYRVANNNGDQFFFIREGASYNTWIDLSSDGKIYLAVSAGDGNLQEVDTYSDTTWYWILVEWQGSGATSEVRASVDGEAPTDWFEPRVDWTTDLDTITLGVNAQSGSQLSYWDYIAENSFAAGGAPSWRDEFHVISSTKSGKGGVGGAMPSCPCAII